jgi:hypothetical protein
MVHDFFYKKAFVYIFFKKKEVSSICIFFAMLQYIYYIYFFLVWVHGANSLKISFFLVVVIVWKMGVCGSMSKC